MAKATRPSTIAIRDGIAVRLQELGFEKRSIRLYLKESGCLSKWVHFRVDRQGTLVDAQGVFDHAIPANQLGIAAPYDYAACGWSGCA